MPDLRSPAVPQGITARENGLNRTFLFRVLPGQCGSGKKPGAQGDHPEEDPQEGQGDGDHEYARVGMKACPPVHEIIPESGLHCVPRFTFRRFYKSFK